MKTTVTKEFRWEMSHRLENHNGLCSNIHGHNYRMLVEVQRLSGMNSVRIDEGMSDEGMVVDFSQLKNQVNDSVVDFFDHSFCYNENNGMNKIIANFLSEEIDQKLARFPYRVTAENIAKFCYKKLEKAFKTLIPTLEIVSITIYENDFSFAKYSK